MPEQSGTALRFHGEITVWIWGRGQRVSRWRLIWLALTRPSEIRFPKEALDA